ncbi:MAG: hypothetical protein KC657_22605 [Myxococcales bacterium]|nr:hypothetical protein [Myxococcales bacterium]
MFLPALGPDDVARLRQMRRTPRPIPAQAPRAPRPITPRRERPAVAGGLLPGAAVAGGLLPASAAQHALLAPAPAPSAAPTSWWEEPLALGSLLVLIPPVGLAVLWSSRRYSREARWALTGITALTMCLVALVAVVAMLG